ncbi:MAG TPA: RNA polymerase sigma factor [Tepidiformaceae bacterium]|nr:RNA polymerase sigma factor [Tepidiformaceae bacterium]
MVESIRLAGTVIEGASAEAGHLEILAARAAEGDQQAFGDIYSLLVDDLYRYIRGQCHNDTVAEDLLSNVFLKAWRSAKSYRSGSGQFRRWIFTIARNELRNHWRASQRTLEVLEHDLIEEDATAAAEEEEDARRLAARALSILTPEQREVVVLRYFGNKTHEQIAAIMGKREGAVRALLLRALRKMRKVMIDASP